MKRVTVLLRTALALLVTLTLSLSLATAAGAQDTSVPTVTISSVSLEGREVVVRGTVTCTGSVTGFLDVSVLQGRLLADDIIHDLECSPGAGTPYEARASGNQFGAGEFGGGRVRVVAHYEYPCGESDDGGCFPSSASGTFTVEGPPPVGIANKSVVLTLYGTPGPDDTGKQFVTSGVGGYETGHCITGPAESTDVGRRPYEYDPCEGNGTQYREDNFIKVTIGSSIELNFTWQRLDDAGDIDEEHTFYQVTEVLKGDKTNYAWYDFDSDTGGGGKGPRPGDVRDDQQGESPEELPDSGAGGLATGASVPWGAFGLAASGLLAAGYAVLRWR